MLQSAHDAPRPKKNEARMIQAYVARWVKAMEQVRDTYRHAATHSVDLFADPLHDCGYPTHEAKNTESCWA